MDNRPIGIFDSGIGGTSIWKEIQKMLPYESCIYLADSKHAPYGEKSKNEIIDLSVKNTEYLLQKGCKIVVVACNTATTIAIQCLRDNYDIPFIGIEPAIKPASLKSQTKVIGILATKGTLSSDLFQETSSLYAQGIKVIEKEGKGIVQLIEGGALQSSKMSELLNDYLNPMIEENIDHLVLGCSHYPYLIPLLKEMLPQSVKIIDSGMAVAKQTKAILSQKNMLSDDENEAYHQFYTNSDVKLLKQFVGLDHKVTRLNF